MIKNELTFKDIQKEAGRGGVVAIKSNGLKREKKLKCRGWSLWTMILFPQHSVHLGVSKHTT